LDGRRQVNSVFGPGGEARLTQPIWLYCASVADIGPADQLAAQASGGHHVVLRLPSLQPDEKAALLARLAAVLPEHSVFDSSVGVTIMPVVARSWVLERRAEVLGAVAEYRRTCEKLVGQYRAGTLPREWWSDEHGEHCRFENWRTGQVVDAPFWESAERFPVDPYFFALFVKTTAGLESVAELIESEFHDGVRILEVVESDAPLLNSRFLGCRYT
jgi:hypothetical protein